MAASTSAPSDPPRDEAPTGALAGLLRVVPGAALLVSAAGEIQGANRAAREALGPGAIDGASLAALTADPDATRAWLRLCARTTEPIPGALVPRRSGSPHSAVGALISPRTEGRAALLALRFWPRESASPFVLLSQKIAELHAEMARRREVEDALRAREARLAEHSRALEEAHRAKDAFLAAVSHELRTPLNAILGWSTLLRAGPPDAPSAQRAVATIERNARAQAHLIDDLLDVSRIVAGRIRLDVQEVDLVVVVESALESVRPSIAAKGIAVRAVLAQGSGLVLGDPARIQQVLWNLLSNAVKFTPKGGRIDVVLRNVDSSVEIEVGDSGIGISPAFLPHVFELFRQEDGSTTRRHGGLGLGLAIARHIVELHGGTIAAHSDGEGHGTRMIVRLPRAALRAVREPARPLARPEPSPPLEAAIEGIEVLAVDDEPDSLALLRAFFESWGASVRTASSAGEALAAIAASPPDVIVSDVGMPEIDGYALVRRVRALAPEDGGRVPAVALTAYARIEDRRAALQAGFDAHVAKPVDGGEILAIVARLLSR